MSRSPLHAYVLHAWDWRESSLVLDLWTREQGRLAVVAKGAKRPTSQLRAVLLPLQGLQIQLTRSKAADADQVHTLRTADWTAAHTLPQGAALLAGYYCNELLMRLLPRQEAHPGLFDAYAQAVHGLALHPQAPELWLRAFELSLLDALGWLPQLDVDSVQQRPLAEERRYQLSPELGLVPSPDGSGPCGASWRRLGQAQDLPARVEALSQRPDRAAFKPALRAVLHYHLGHAPMRSRTVLHQAHDLLST